MATILHIISSSNLQSSFTRQVGVVAVDRLKATHTNAKFIERDLVKNPVPHISPEFLGALFSGDEKADGLSLSNQLIEELIASDLIVIEAPMYNFSIPSVLKAWIDHVVRANKTFQYTANGPDGLLKGKKVILLLASGGVYSDGPYKAADFQETYLRTILGFVGLSHIETIRVEGVALGEERAAAALEQAKQKASILD